MRELFQSRTPTSFFVLLLLFWRSNCQDSISERPPGPVQPGFRNNSYTNVTAQLGGTGFLHCRVGNLRDRTISWIRVRDYHLLTTGSLMYTNDQRFQLLHKHGEDDWTLQIKYLAKHDNGTYECQVSTGTGIISTFVNLFIAEPEAFILGRGEHHVERGSTISLVCIIDKSTKAPQFVMWYHNNELLNYGNKRGGVTVTTEPGTRTHSRLAVENADYSDTGNYTCSASNTTPDSIRVYVTEGDKTAAIHRREDSSACPMKDNVVFSVCIVLVVMVLR